MQSECNAIHVGVNQKQKNMSYSTQIECRVMFIRENAQSQGKQNRITLQQIISPDFMSLEDHRALWCSTVHATVLEDDDKNKSLITNIRNENTTHTFDKQQNVHSANNSE